MKNVIFIAPPAAGKGTQSKVLIKRGYEHIATGDMLREEINNETPIGKKIKDILKKGRLVDDDIVFEIVKNRIKKLEKPFILDGYPRTLEQAKMLDNLFNEINLDDYQVIYLDIPVEEGLKRILGRLVCKCGATYNTNIPGLSPKEVNICDRCGKPLFRRNDDNEKTFRKRFETFKLNNEKLINYYKDKNKLNIVDMMMSQDKIVNRIKEILE